MKAIVSSQRFWNLRLGLLNGLLGWLIAPVLFWIDIPSGLDERQAAMVGVLAAALAWAVITAVYLRAEVSWVDHETLRVRNPFRTYSVKRDWIDRVYPAQVYVGGACVGLVVPRLRSPLVPTGRVRVVSLPFSDADKLGLGRIAIEPT